jgi:Family of unknown function (DUF1028)
MLQRSYFSLVLLCFCFFSCFAQDKPLRPVHTFSIVAFDPQTGEMGVAVQSHWFAVGGEVPWAEAGVGAVATQSFIDPGYGPLGLGLMRAGKSAPAPRTFNPRAELPGRRQTGRSRCNAAGSMEDGSWWARTMPCRPT